MSKKKPNIWFTSDTHFGHANIIKFCRPEFGLGQQDKMDEEMIDKWNAVVEPNDIVYHGGDFIWKHPSTGEDEATYAKRIAGSLNGRIRLMLGNHDNAKLLLHYNLVESIALWGVFKKEEFILTHFPLAISQVREGFVNVHGHTHNNEIGEAHHFNICVEHTDYAPVSYDQMLRNVKWQRHEMMKAGLLKSSKDGLLKPSKGG